MNLQKKSVHLLVLISVTGVWLQCKLPIQPISIPCIPDSALTQVQLTRHHSIRAIHFVNPTLGWLVAAKADSGGPGYTSMICKTEDGGLSWQPQRADIRQIMNAVWFFDPMRGVAAGQGGILIQTTNGGCSWTDLQFDTAINYWSLYFDNNSIGWLVGYIVNTPTPGCGDGLHAIYMSIDCGARWTKVFEGTDGALVGIFSGGRHVWAVGGGILDNFCPQLIVRSSNNGVSWSSQRTGFNGPLVCVNIQNDSIGFAGGFGTVRTSDGGTTWSRVPVPFNHNNAVVGIQARGGQIIRVVRQNKIERTTDDGRTFITEFSTNYNLFRSFFLSDSMGWAVGTSAVVLGYRANQWSILHTGP
jgi:photosystem II stability/assembly factor-like uncharacterized protein